MAKNLANLRSFGDMESDVFVAPMGTAKPTDLVTVGPEFEALGWIAEDGVSEGFAVEVVKHKLWQAGATGRTKANGTEKTMVVQAAESNPLVFELFYGSSAPVTTTGITEIEIPKGVGTVARAAAFKFVDGENIYIRYNTRAEVTDRGEVTYNNAELAIREMTFDLIGDDFWLTNDPSFEAPAG